MAVARHSEAVPVLQRAIAAEPEDATARCMLAACLLNLGRHAEGASMAATAIPLNPDSGWPHRIRSIALRDMGKTREALAAAKEAVRLEPDEPLGVLVLGEAQLGSRPTPSSQPSGWSRSGPTRVTVTTCSVG